MDRILFCLIVFIPFFKKESTSSIYANTITQDRLKNHLYRVANLETAGREIGTIGERIAAEYIEMEFKRTGLYPGNNVGFRQYYDVYFDSLISSVIEVNDTRFTLDYDYSIFPVKESFVSSSYSVSEVVFLGNGTEDDFKDANLWGKVLLIYRNNKTRLDLAHKHGVMSLLIIDPENNRFPASRKSVDLVKSYLYTNRFIPDVHPNKYFISVKIAEAIMGVDFNSVISGSLKQRVFPVKLNVGVNKLVLSRETSNVISVVEGSDFKEQAVILSAHYDHLGIRDNLIYYGADDNGSGVAALLEIAAAFAKAKREGRGPRRTIIFVAFSGEEYGRWGSQYYTNNPVFPLINTQVNLNMDMIGRIDDDYRNNKDSLNYIYTVGDNLLSPELDRVIFDANSRIGMKIDKKYNSPDNNKRKLYASDQYSFFYRGIPVVLFSDGYAQASQPSDYHQPTDTPDKINYALLNKRSKLIFYVAWELSNRKSGLRVV